MPKGNKKTVKSPEVNNTANETLNNNTTLKDDRNESYVERFEEMQKEIDLLKEAFVQQHNNNGNENGRVPNDENGGSRVSSRAASVAGSDVDYNGGGLSTIVSALNETLRFQNSSKRLYDLPIFDGRAEDWPVFKEAFLATTNEYDYSNQQNLLRLQKAIRGNAREVVESLLILSKNVPRVLETLEIRFGNPERLVKSQISKVRSYPAIEESKLENIIHFATKVQNLSAFLEAAGCDHHLCNPTLMEELVMKLPVQRRMEWARYAMSLRRRANIIDFSQWLREVAEMVAIVCPVSEVKHKNADRNEGKQRFFHASAVDACPVCEKEHDLDACQQFKSMHITKKWKVVRRNKLCFKCLKSGHRSSTCTIESSSRKKVHPLLNDVKEAISMPKEDNQSAHVFTSSYVNKNTQVFFKIVPVTLYANNKQVDCYAFLDDGASVTLMNESLATKLGLQGPKSQLTLKWFGSSTKTEDSSCFNIKVSGTKGNSKIFDLCGVHTVKDLRLPTQTVKLSDLGFHSGKRLPICEYENAKPDLLIGLNNAHIGIPRRYVSEAWNGPVAVLTKLGWIVYGRVSRSSQEDNNAFVVCCIEQKDELNELVKKYIANEEITTKQNCNIVESEEVKRANQLLQNYTRKVGKQFESVLLWKSNEFKPPDSKSMAMKRFSSLERKFLNDASYKIAYANIINDYEKKGYCRKVTDEDIFDVNHAWYLPHFGVRNPNKPEKLRLVFDAAAEVNGVSLNSMLLSGPDLCKPLLEVLFKFRQNPVGVVADIVEMFHRVKIRYEDQSAQRFVWRSDVSEPINEYVMTVMTFGATCSPCVAQYVKNLNASNYEKLYPVACKAILNNFYVDDYVHSFQTEGEAIQISKEVKWIQEQAGFELTRFASGSSRVQAELSDKRYYNDNVNLDKGSLSTPQKVLGMFWDTKNDSLRFVLAFGKIDADLLTGRRIPTKRELLSITMSVFDPFGIAAEHSLIAKLIMQSVWRQQAKWDEEIPPSVHDAWKKWLNALNDIENCKIPRCYGNLFMIKPVELHVFADASELAYAAVAYWRILEDTDQIKLSFVMGKTKCAPLKLVSVPRLELEAAVLAVRLKQTILRSHDIKPIRVVMWSDSRTALSWIRSNPRQYKPFVAHRVEEILESSEISDWKWVPTGANPADYGTRIPAKKRESFWLSGPQFLHENEDSWPQCKMAQTKEEIRSISCRILLVSAEDFYTRFSSFERMKRIVAWMMRFISGCLNRERLKSKRFLTTNELNKANILICKMVQHEAYAEEIAELKSNKKVKKSSSLFKLTPCLDENEVIRVNGRINNASTINLNTRQPIIMPKGHFVTNLIIYQYHKRWLHQNDNTIIAELRRCYWTPDLRESVKKIRRSCLICQKRTAEPRNPLMGQLPEDRLTPFVRAFTYTGLDYMGPFNVAIGRRAEKRWIALFTCMSSRAVHMELVKNLSTDACLMALSNFINRRGVPVRIRSDNGTNFVGAKKQLQKEATGVDPDKVGEFLAMRNVEWIFNCPLNPHAGGVWERLVRSVKRALFHSLSGSTIQEHTLYNVMCEAENILNSRPLTYIPLDDPTDEPLTPNHFILGTANSEQTPSPDGEHFKATRKQWRIAQHIQRAFWKKWVDEYLPDLCRRTKWYEPVKPLEKGDIVIVCDASMHRSTWPMGRITNVYPGKDKQVRVVEVQTSTGLMKRPACKIAKLDVGKSSIG